ncbi:threonylcarbamoyl-AMP synthase [Rhodobacteraceae bacterium NNCM2]|nr:threonylcarbamoyl-AMP synthase [Coraliihabitans acroporae]
MPQTVVLGPDAEGLAEAARLLGAGGLVSFPTETVYGLGADARNGEAVAGIYSAKGRPEFNPLIVHVLSLEDADRYAEIEGPLRQLAERFWPGPLTLVAPRRPAAAQGGLSDLVTAGLETVALRVPAHPLARELLRTFGGPVAAPSANPSGRISPTTARHVLDGLAGRIDAVVDGGDCAVGLESTIVGMDEGRPVLLRPGGLSAEDISDELGVEIAGYVEAAITAPGQMSSHYAPRARLRLNAEAPSRGEGWLGFGPGISTGLNLSPSGNLTEAAANLFGYLHRLDAEVGGGTIAVAPVPETGLGRAINDRLRRAAAPKP